MKRPIRLLLLLLSLSLLLSLLSPVPASAQAGSDAEAPLRARDGQLVVTVLAADGTELDFRLGTSSPPTVLAESTIERFGETPVLTVGGVPIQLDGHQTWPDDRLSPGAASPVAGIIGASMLRDYDVLVDLPGGRLLLRDVGPPRPWEGVDLSDPVPVQILHGSVVSLSTRVGDAQIFTLLDLAAAATVFSPPTTERLGLEPEGEVTIGLGATELRTPYEQRDLPVFRNFDPDGNGFIILGAPIATDCPLALSWARRELRVCVR